MTLHMTGPFFDSNGTRIHLGKKMGSGGEGDVFEISSSRHTLVAKIYHKPLDTEKQEKLRLMVHGCNDDLKAISAWPTALVQHGQKGPVCGFLMPRIAECEPIHKLYGPSHRKEVFPEADWKFLVRAAQNLVSAFYVIHKYGYVIGDVNEGNILVNHHACVRLIDCDSLQVQTREHIWYCEVGVAQFTPPEIQNSKDFRMLRSENHDNFGLAILIFLLLFMGRHPFSGVYHGKEDMPIEKAIQEYRFAFGKTAGYKSISPPPNSVDLSIVPREVADLFEQAFTETGARQQGRPRAEDWWNELNTLEKRLKICRAESSHRYFSGLVSCPWCSLENSSRVVLFLNADSISRIDLTKEWNSVVAVNPPGRVPDIGPDNYHPLPKPLSNELERAREFTKFRWFAAVILVIAAVLVVMSDPLLEYWYMIPAAVIIAGILCLFPGKEMEEKKKRNTAYENARYTWDLWNKKWIREAGDAEFQGQLKKLQRLKRQYETIEKEYQNALNSLHHFAKERQLQKFLDGFFIDSYRFPMINENRKAALRSFGIETAADITPENLAGIPGFSKDPAIELFTWRQQIEKKFIFDPSKGTEKSDVQALLHKFQPKMGPVEQELRVGLETLYQTQQKILRNRAKFQPMVEKSAQELAQARANVRVFEFRF